MNKRKSLISILVTLAILVSSLINTYAADSSDKLIMDLKLGSSIAKAYGSTYTIEKPYVAQNTIMVPLAWVAAALGAEVDWKGNNTIGIIYQELNAEIKIGSAKYTVNSEAKKLTQPPVIKNNRTMIPLDFIASNFPVTVTSDKKNGNIRIVLNDDGALEDLSFLTGGITTPAVGNSFYGWSLKVPSGSRIISNDFKSGTIGITNESRSLYFEISAENKNGRKLSDLYEDLSYLNNVRSSKINQDAAVPYFEYTRLTEYEEALRVKVFDKGDYFYYMTINCYDNTVSPEKLMSEKYYNNIMDSFSFNYKGNVKGVEDLSKVVNGKVNFYNYVSLDGTSKYMPWSINIPVKWNQILKSDDPLTTNLGLDSQHYMKITMNTLDEGKGLEEYVDGIKSTYDKYFNPKVYSFISSDNVNIAGADTVNLKFSIKQSDKTYIIDEYYFTKGQMVFEISVKLPENEYEKGKSQFLDAINQMTFYSIDNAKYQSDLEKYNSKNLQVRVSQQDDPFDYTDKTNHWTAKIPGYWTKSSSGDDNTATFDNPNTNAYIMITALENNSLTKSLTDEEKFSFMQLLKTRYDAGPVKSVVSNDSGTEVRKYVYRIEDMDMDLYATVTCYCFESGNYSYLFTSVEPDLTATDESVKEIEGIWQSLKPTK